MADVSRWPVVAPPPPIVPALGRCRARFVRRGKAALGETHARSIELRAGVRADLLRVGRTS